MGRAYKVFKASEADDINRYSFVIPCDHMVWAPLLDFVDIGAYLQPFASAEVTSQS